MRGTRGVRGTRTVRERDPGRARSLGFRKPYGKSLWYHGSVRDERRKVGRRMTHDGYAMKVSNKGLYAVRMMLHLAERGQGGAIALKDIAKAQLISKKYLEQITPALTAAKLVRSVRGAQGGYLLARRAADISMFDVLDAVEGNLLPIASLEDAGIEGVPGAPLLEANLWRGLDDTVRDYLSGISLQDIVDRESPIAADSYSI